MIHGLTGFVDYDRPHLGGLTDSEKIDYFEYRVRLVVLNPASRWLQTPEVSGIVGSSALLMIGVSLCCAVEATGKFVDGMATAGAGKNRARFFAFLSRYMSADYQTRTVSGLTFGDSLWTHFRNGIAHGFAVSHGGFEGDRGDPYFKVTPIAGRDCLMVNPFLLFNDYQQGFGRYIGDLRACVAGAPQLSGFLRVFKDVFIDGN